MEKKGKEKKREKKRCVGTTMTSKNAPESRNQPLVALDAKMQYSREYCRRHITLSNHDLQRVLSKLQHWRQFDRVRGVGQGEREEVRAETVSQVLTISMETMNEKRK